MGAQDLEEMPQEFRAILGRRALLRSALAGFTLAASGLLLPTWQVDGVARQVDRDADLGGRHGQNQRGRDRGHRRNRHDRRKDRGSDRNPPRGPLDNEGVRNIRFIVVNDNALSTEPIGVSCYSYQWNTLTVVSGEDKTIRPETGEQFTTNVKQAALFIDHDRHIVWAKNPFYSECTIEIASAGGRGGAGPKAMAVGATLAWQHGSYKISVARLPDDDTHKNFTVTYES